MGRPPGQGGPAFRFTPNEVAEMESILQEHQNTLPPREVLVAIAEKFSESVDRKGKFVVQMKQVWNWFQNRRYSVRAKTPKTPVKLNVMPMPRDSPTPAMSVPQPVAPQPVVPSMPAPVPAHLVPGGGKATSENSYMEFEAKSTRDGAWYDVGTFLSHRYLDTGDLEVLVRFSGFGPEEDEWLNVRKNVRQRSLPCEASECVAVLPGDLILCFQEGKDQALYFDAHVLDAQRRRHDVRGCRCRFLVRYDHDQSEEIVPLRKVCRRPETDYRLQQLYAKNDSAGKDQLKTRMDPSMAGFEKVTTPPAETPPKPSYPSATPAVAPVPQANASLATGTAASEPKNSETHINRSAANNPIEYSASGLAIGVMQGNAAAVAGENMQGS